MMTPDWPAPSNVKAVITERIGGVSQPPFSSFNLATHVGDNPEIVEQNRQILAKFLVEQGNVSAPRWLNQIHSTDVCNLDDSLSHNDVDGAMTRSAQRICAVLTADCMPVLMCDKNGAQVAAVHAGWRGLASGILSTAIGQFCAASEDLYVYLGPAIGQAHFEVGEDVLEQFAQQWRLRNNSDSVNSYFRASDMRADKWYGDLVGLAKSELNNLGVTAIYGGQHCTVEDNHRFYSYRKEGRTGRFASLIWFE